jgi:hypothetical protein
MTTSMAGQYNRRTMNKFLGICALSLLVASSASATYWVVMKDGTRYQAKAKPVVQGGRAIITTNNGQTLAVDPNAIDYPKSEEVTRLGGGELLGTEQRPVEAKPQVSPLGSQIHLRKNAPAASSTAVVTPTPPPNSSASISSDVMNKFARAFENIGIYEQKMSSEGPRTLRADITADNEEKVFNAISATAFLMTNLGTVDEVQLYMKTTTGAAAGRFHITKADAATLYAGNNSPDRHALELFFVNKVLF